MRNIFFLGIFVFGIFAIYAEIPTRYYIGITEVPESEYNSVPDSIKYVISEYNYDTLEVKSIELLYTHYLDSISNPGKFIIKERSKEEIDFITNRLRTINNDYTSQIIKLNKGDSVQNFSLINYSTQEINNDFLEPGRCYLLSFWATWCGNCLAELKPEFIPSIAKEFSLNPNFMFAPICIDASASELQDFFAQSVGFKWGYLSDVTYLDIDRKVNNLFAEGGNIPLNVVVGADGHIKYIHLGKIVSENELTHLREAITEGLANN